MIDMFGMPYTTTTAPNEAETIVYNEDCTDEVELSLEELQEAYNLTEKQAQKIWDKYDEAIAEGKEK